VLSSSFPVPPPQGVAIGRLDLASGTAAIVRQPTDCQFICTNVGGSAFVEAPADGTGQSIFASLIGSPPSQPGTQTVGVARIDAATGRVDEYVETGMAATSLAIHPFKRELAAGGRQDTQATFSILLTSPLKLQGSIVTDDRAYDDYPFPRPVFDASGRYVFMLSHTDLVKVDVQTQQVVGRYRGAGFAEPLVDPRRPFVYVSDTLAGKVHAIHQESMQLVWTLDIVSPVSYVLDKRGRLLVQTLPGAELQLAYDVAVVDPDRGSLLTTLRMEGDSFVRSIGTSRVIRKGKAGDCDVVAAHRCLSDALFEIDEADGHTKQRIRLDLQVADEVPPFFRRAVAVWISFLPEPGTAVEYYHAGFDHYFLTADTGEIDALDRGAFQGWQRTGESLGVLRSDAGVGAGYVAVCRFYGRPERGLDSHFYSASREECDAVEKGYDGAWVRERDDAFYVARVDATSGACPEGTAPVYRFWNGRFDSNHRYTTSAAVRSEMTARGYVPEGPGGVAFCARQ
jgi:hypothetical protein